MSDNPDRQGPFSGLRLTFLSHLADRAKAPAQVQETRERQTGLKLSELHSYPFLHRLPPLPPFLRYTCDRARSLVLPFVADLEPSTPESQQRHISVDGLNLCDAEYLRLNRCVLQSLSKEDKGRPKFNRLSRCKYHYIIYWKCVTKRNRAVDRLIFRHEIEHLRDLAPADRFGDRHTSRRAEYLGNLEKQIKEWRPSGDPVTEESEQHAINLNVELMKERLKRLRKEV